MRIKTLILTLLMCLCLGVSASASGDVITALGILPEGLYDNDTVTRDLLSFAAVKLADYDAVGGENIFLDTEGNEYAGYINASYNLGILRGTSATEFSPSAPATLSQIDAAMVRALGYESIISIYGDVMGSYVKTADMLGINDDVNLGGDSEVTVLQLKTILENTLKVSLLELDGKGFTETNKYYLSEKLGLSVYRGMVTGLSDDSKKAVVNITGVEYASRYSRALAGDTVSFSASPNMDFYEYEFVDAYIWVNEDEEIVYAEPKKSTKVLYTHIYSVNGDEAEDSEYAADYLTRMVLYDDTDEEYDLAENAVIRYNGEMADGKSLAYAGRFAKIVIAEDEVILVDCYDTVLGGLITAASSEEISLLKSESQTSKLKEIDEIKKVLVFIDGKKCRLSDLKVNSVLSYYKAEGVLVIDAGEKAISEVLDAVSDTKITIGGIEYNRKGTYFSNDGKYYSQNSDNSGLYNTNVTAYFDSVGNCIFVGPMLMGEVKDSDFLGLVLGYSNEDDLANGILRVYVIEPTPQKLAFNVSKRLQIDSSLGTLNDILATANTVDGTGVYLFETNAKGEIYKISPTEPVYGFNKSVSVTSFANTYYDPYVGMTVNGRAKTLFFKDAPFYTLYEESGKPIIEKIDWSILGTRFVYDGKTVTFNIYGRGIEAAPRLVLLTGGVDSVRANEKQLGVVVNKTLAINDEDELVYELTIRANSDRVITVTEEYGKTIPEKALVLYYDGTVLSKTGGLVIDYVADLTGTSDTWAVENEAKGIYRGVVSRIDEDRVFIEDGSEYGDPMYLYVYSILEYDSKSGDFTTIDYTNVEVGSEVIYYLIGECRGMIVIK